MIKRVQNRAAAATIKVRNFYSLREVALSLGADLQEILFKSQLDPDLFSDPERTVPFAQADRLLSECLRATGCEDFGLRAGAIGGAAATGLAGLVSLNCQSVRDGLKTIAEGLKTSNTGGTVILGVRGREASLGYAVVAPGIENADQIIDWGMARLANVMRQLCGADWRPERVFLTRASPVNLDRFDAHFQAPNEFCAPAAKFTFDAAVLDQPVKASDPQYREILAPFLDKALAETGHDFASAVKSILKTQLGDGRLTREKLADAMGLSVHVLTRRLRKSGESFSHLADAVKLELAETLLRTRKPIVEIAASLGFSDTCAFTRTFRKWTGTTPGRWRAERGGCRIPAARDRGRANHQTDCRGASR